MKVVSDVLLYLVQHAGEGRKTPRGATGQSFRDAALTALFAHDQGVAVSRIYHSGIKGATDRAGPCRSGASEEGVSEADWLAPMDDHYGKRLSKMHEDIMLVSPSSLSGETGTLLLCADASQRTSWTSRIPGSYASSGSTTVIGRWSGW